MIMYLKLRILFTILSAVCLAVVIPATALFGWLWLGVFGGGAALFYLLMLYFKRLQEAQESKNAEPEPDFLHPERSTKENAVATENGNSDADEKQQED